jgi:hypothetical protein
MYSEYKLDASFAVQETWMVKICKIFELYQQQKLSQVCYFRNIFLG